MFSLITTTGSEVMTPVSGSLEILVGTSQAMPRYSRPRYAFTCWARGDAVESLASLPASALTGLHTLLGTGTAMAPLLVAALIKNFGWWLLPVFALAALLMILTGTFFLPLKEEKTTSKTAEKIPTGKFSLSVGVWLFLLLVLFYGICETMFSNWAIVFLKKERGIAPEQAGYALAVYWMMVTVGRLVVAIISVWISPSLIYRILAIMITSALFVVSVTFSPITGIIFFGLAGLSCSAFFPLTFSFAQKRFESMAETVSGWLMAAYKVGYGLASYAVGKVIETEHFSLGNSYLACIVPAAGMIFLTMRLTKNKE